MHFYVVAHTQQNFTVFAEMEFEKYEKRASKKDRLRSCTYTLVFVLFTL